MQNSKIAIIGAGVSGLAAAVRLVERGARHVTLFEARREAGGRTRSYIDSVTGDALDNGQHLMMGCYHATLRYVHTIGSEAHLKRLPLWIRFHDANSPSFSRRGLGGGALLQLPPKSKPPANLVAGLWNSKLLNLREKLAALWLGLSIDASSAKNAEGLTCAEFFRKLHQPAGVVKKLWEPIVLATTNARLDQASAVLFVNVFREAFLSGPEASDLLLPATCLSEVLINPAIQMLDKLGVKIRLSTPVRAIEKNDAMLHVVMDSYAEDFDAVIYSGQASDPLPVEVRTRIPKFDYSPIVNAYFWLDRPILRGPIHGFLGTTLQWAFPWPSNFAAERLALTVSAGNELAERSNEEIRHILWTELCAAVPEAREARLLHHQIIREKRATPVFTPLVQQNRPSAATAIPNLFLAGDIVQNGLPATIEGAIRNGFGAAGLLHS